jgi:hypothetical protein
MIYGIHQWYQEVCEQHRYHEDRESGAYGVGGCDYESQQQHGPRGAGSPRVDAQHGPRIAARRESAHDQAAISSIR